MGNTISIILLKELNNLLDSDIKKYLTDEKSKNYLKQNLKTEHFINMTINNFNSKNAFRIFKEQISHSQKA